jgi:ABC-type multidrug transport system ATPase subunit
MRTPQTALRLDAQGLYQHVNGKAILSDVSLSVHPGECVGLLGPSGAGKSTLLNALNGFRPADQGRVLLNGTNLYKHAERFRRMLGYVPQDDIVHTSLSVRSALQYAALLRLPPDTPKQTIQHRVAEVLKTLELDAHAKSRIKKLSGGQRKRVSLGIELLTSPPLLFLDEPTSGLDPGLEERMMTLFHTLARQGRTVILTTHIMESLHLLDLVAVLNKGWLMFYGPPQLALQAFQVQEFSDIYDVLAKFQPAALAQQYAQSPIYRKYVTARLSKRYKTEHIAEMPVKARKTSPPVEEKTIEGKSVEEELEALKRKLQKPGHK